MLSDDSSSDSETGRFKQSKATEENRSSRKDYGFKSSGRTRHSDNRFRRDFERKRDVFDKHSREHRYSRHSPVRRRRHSRDRSPRRRSPEILRHRDSSDISKAHDHRSGSRDRRKRSRSHKSSEPRSKPKKSPEPKQGSNRLAESKPRTNNSPESTNDLKKEIRLTIEPSKRSPENKRDLKAEIRHTLGTIKRSPDPKRILKEEISHTLEPIKKSSDSQRDMNETKRRQVDSGRRSPVDKRPPKKERSPIRFDRRSREKILSSPENKGMHSEYIKSPSRKLKRKSDSPIVIDEVNDSDESGKVQMGSYYNMIPALVMNKSEDSSEIDSSDDERLRAKLLNLEKELHKNKKKKHKKKHKRKQSRKDKDDGPTTVEVTSTTDIQEKVENDSSQSQAETVPEVTSTQKTIQKDSSEEGEISSEESEIKYDPSDLRYKLSRNAPKSRDSICGPALPPHLERCERSSIEGPALPPQLQTKSRIVVGPSIADNMRRALAETPHEIIEYASSDEDTGIGPMPAGVEGRWSEAQQRLEERALDIKIKTMDGRSLDSQKIKSREEWMLQLPEGKAKYLGLEARSFRAKEGPDMSDRSSWTDTPEEKARKAAGIVKEEDPEMAMRKEARQRLIANRDDEQESAVKKHKKKHKREESLLEMHQKKLKKKKKKEEKEDGKKERRPFSRDVDLQVNRFDDAQKKSIIKKAQDLNSRFGRGEAKYL